MNRKTIARTAASFVGLAMVLGVAAPAGAQTIAELQAQINALMAQLAALQGGSAPVATGANFTMNLTVGSRGTEVTALQQMLVAQGHLTMPAGVAYGTFGPLTRSAVASWQAANGVAPAAGYWGPLSRTRANSMAGTPGTTPTTPVAGITTPGVEGTLSATLNATPVSGEKIYEGDSRRAILGIKLEAKTSDIRVERVRVQLPSNAPQFYNRVASRIYIMDGSTVVGSADLNSNTVIRDGINYFITIAGMSYVVPKDSTRVLNVAFDINSSVDSGGTFRGPYTITIPEQGVRGTDGAGINQFAPLSGTLSRSLTVGASLADSAELKISLNSATPKAAQIIASSGTGKDERDGVELLRFDLKAEKDSVKVKDFTVTLTSSGGTATTTTLYLYEGSTLIASETGNAGVSPLAVKFSNIDYTVPKDATRTLSVKTDIRSAGTSATTLSAAVSATSGASLVAENSTGSSLDDGKKIGTASGENIGVMKSGVEISLVSTNVSYTPPQAIAGATSTAKATFVVNVKAVGSDIFFGTQSASSTFNVGTFKGGTLNGFANASTTNFITPSSGVVISGIGGTNAFKLVDGNDVNVTIEVIFPGRNSDGTLLAIDAYAFGLQSVKWSRDGISAPNTTDFMSGRTEWRTSSVTLP